MILTTLHTVHGSEIRKLDVTPGRKNKYIAKSTESDEPIGDLTHEVLIVMRDCLMKSECTSLPGQRI
jgi:hypothetical protein